MDTQDILNGYATDMAAVETHIAEAIERQLASDETQRYPSAVATLSTLHTTLRAHVDALEQYNSGTEGGGIAEAVKEAVTGALGVAAGVYDMLRGTDKVSRMVRDTYTATSLAAVSYHMLYTTALGLKDDRLAGLALANLRGLTPLMVDLSKVVCTVVAAELTAEGKLIDPTVADEAIAATQEAWSADAVSA